MKILNAIYPSPNLRYDIATREVVFERLNPKTGDVVFQAPSRERLKEEEHAAAISTTAGQHLVDPSPAPETLPPVAQPGAAATHATPPPAKSDGRPAISIVV